MSKVTACEAHPATDRVEVGTSGTICQIRTARKATETDSPATAAAVAEFAHDLCSPLNALAFTARSLRDAAVSDGQSKDLDTIVRITEHALGIVRDVLDRARIEAAIDIPRREACDLQLLISDVAAVSRPCAQAKNLELTVCWDPACPRFVRTDASRLQRVLINLLDNAVKYTQQGAVTLFLSIAENHDPEHLWLTFEVRDTGIGIARRDRGRIFERFVRGSGTEGTIGNGLGLAVVSQLVHQMGGTLQVESKIGAGSSFCIELPVGRAQETSGAHPQEEPAAPALPLEELAGLPDALLAELRDSVVALDVHRISETIEQVAQSNATLGENLKRLASHYAFTAVLEAIEACGSLQGASLRLAT